MKKTIVIADYFAIVSIFLVSKLVYVQLYVQVSQCIWVDFCRPVWKLFFIFSGIGLIGAFSMNLQGSIQLWIRYTHLPPIDKARGQ